MSITGSNLTADAVQAYLRSKREEEAAKQRAFEASVKAERDKVREAFQEREVQPEAMDRIAAVIRKSIDMGEKQALVLRFPSDWLPDQGRAITNHDKNWHEKLDGFAKRAYDFYDQNLREQGYRLRAQILEYPDGKPGDVGLFLSW